jgi:hypothetical protein
MAAFNPTLTLVGNGFFARVSNVFIAFRMKLPPPFSGEPDMQTYYLTSYTQSTEKNPNKEQNKRISTMDHPGS